MKHTIALAAVLSVSLCVTAQPLRPPAVPLVTHDPYFSCWSFNDALHQDWPKHWTGAVNAMTGMVRVDGKPYRFMGGNSGPLAAVPAAKQTSIRVTPTQSSYKFVAGPVDIFVRFLSPIIASDLELVSRPVTYVKIYVNANDRNSHKVEVYFDATAEWCVNSTDQNVVWGRAKIDDLTAMHIGTKDQPVLAKKGDNLRIDWGRFYVAAAGEVRSVIASDEAARGSFVREGTLPKDDDDRMPRSARDKWPVLAIVAQSASVNQGQTSLGSVMLAYDDDFGIEYMNKRLRPWWKRDGATIEELLKKAQADVNAIDAQSYQFDAKLMTDLERFGGKDYAQLCALAYRQCLAAHKLVASEDGKTPLYFSKENFSNGCIDTVDVTYPSSPFFLLLNPTLLKGQLTPILDYASSDRWKFPFAPHDLGTYPKANGQVYGGGEKTEANQMPVEESGNMLIMLGALAHIEGNAKYAEKYWPTITKWAAYLREKGLDPENQLCTDDFAGHLAHNTNLSLKAIVALEAYARLADMLGKKDDSMNYHKDAQEMANKWQSMAADGDHYRLTFDKPGTWSQKYNLVWDKLLGYNLFPKEVREKEIAYYKTRLNDYGLPLDNRKAYTKLDWIVWTATLADKPEDFSTILAPSVRWISATPSRVPLTDWYDTVTAKQSGFQARSVVGGVFIKALSDEKLWREYAKP